MLSRCKHGKRSRNGSVAHSTLTFLHHTQKAYLQSLEDELAGRDPATFPAGPAVEFCLEMPEFCPGGDAYAPTSENYADGPWSAPGPEEDGPVAASGAQSGGRGLGAASTAAVAVLTAMVAAGAA